MSACSLLSLGHPAPCEWSHSLCPFTDRPQGEVGPHRPGESGRVYGLSLPAFPVRSMLAPFSRTHSRPTLLQCYWSVDGKVISGFGAQKEPRSRQEPHPRNPAFTNCQCDHLAPSSLFRTKTPQSPPQPTCSREGSVYPEGKRCYAWTHKPAVTHRLCDTGRVP